MSSLSKKIEDMPAINRRIIPALKRLGIFTVRDFLFHFPSRYEDFSHIKPIAEITAEERVTAEGKIVALKNFRTARKQMHITEAVIKDSSGSMRAIWFNQPFLLRRLKTDTLVRLSGKVSLGQKGMIFQNPAYEKVSWFGANETLHTGALVPVYPESAGLTSRWLRFLIKLFIEKRAELEDFLPEEILKNYGLPALSDALLHIHFPQSKKEADDAKRRFAFEELLLIQLHALRERARLKAHIAPAIPLDLALVQEFIKKLPFSLTNAQRRSLWEILKDMEKTKPMNRLLEGDVGSGKTIIATAASLLVVRAGFRVLFMAPTEILARQHFETAEKFLRACNVKIGLLTGSEKHVQDSTNIIIGTHALIQKHVSFTNLGLVVVDEQHRFGVEQRRALQKNQESRIKNKGNLENFPKNSSPMLPHFLSMSATPIPRTLALTIYGDLDLSIIDELPKSRRQIITKIVTPIQRQDAYDFIRKEVKTGRQGFIICPKIEPKAKDDTKIPSPRTLLMQDVKNVKEECQRLKEKVFPDLTLAMLHGKMKPKEKNEIMLAFKDKRYDMLVSTSVVEVGVDIPNATIMLIEGAECFGLAQLHQFRGRVGRSEHQSYCLLFPTEEGATTRRLYAIIEAKNGFELAEKDLEIRGPGDLFGARQSGIPDLALANITNVHLVREVRDAARYIVQSSPDISLFPALSKKIKEFESAIHLE